MQAPFLPWIGLALSIAGGIFTTVFQASPVKLIGSIFLYFGGSILLLNVSSAQSERPSLTKSGSCGKINSVRKH